MSTAEEAGKLPPRHTGESVEDYHRRLQMEYVPAPRVEIVAEQTHDKTGRILDEVKVSGEPIFVLRAKDIFAPMVVSEYLALAEKYNPRAHTLHGQVGEIQDQMLDWQRANMDKVRYPD